MKLYLTKYMFICLVAIGLLLVSSCKDDEQDPNPNRAPQVNVQSPTKNAIYNSEEEIPLVISIDQNANIVSYRVLVRDRNTEKLVFIKSEFTDVNRIDLDTTITLSTSTSTIMDIEVRAEDSFGNQVDEVVSCFQLNPPEGNILSLNFDLNYDGEVLLMNEAYNYPTGERFEFSKFDMFVSNITLISDSNETTIKDLDFLAMTQTYRNLETAQEGYNYRIAGLDDGVYEAVRFNIGLTPEQNSTTPSDYPVSHPLGSGDYWEGWTSYIFTSIEGRMDIDTSNPDFEQGLALHLGSDDAMRIIEIPLTFDLSNNEEEIINIDIDLKDLFIDEQGDIYDIITTPQIHDLEDVPMVIELSNNLKNSINN